MIRTILFCGASMTFLACCSSQGVYDSFKYQGLMECDKMAGSEREKCRKQYGMSYKDYERAREEAVSAD